MVILDLEVLKHGSEVGRKIGNPVVYDTQQPSNNANPSEQPPIVKLHESNLRRPETPRE